MKTNKIYIWSMLLCMVLSFIACSDNEETAEQLELVGGCWVCAQNGYNDMLEFTADGTVTSNGVQGNETWGLNGTYLFAGNTLSMDFGSEKREGDVKVLDEEPLYIPTKPELRVTTAVIRLPSMRRWVGHGTG